MQPIQVTGTHQELGRERCACEELRSGSEPQNPSCSWLESHRCFLTQMFIPVKHLSLWVPGVGEAKRWWRRDVRGVYGREAEASVRRKNGGHPRKEEGLEFICAYSRVTADVFRRGLFSFRPLVWEALDGSGWEGLPDACYVTLSFGTPPTMPCRVPINIYF